MFSVSVNLATLLIDPRHISPIRLLLIIAALCASTIGLVLISYVLKAAEQDAAGKPNPRKEKLANINDRLWTLCVLLSVALAPLMIVMIYRLLA